jgi:hypothetical protein
MHVAFSWRSGPKIDFCPFCGVNLDEPVALGDPILQALNPIK